MLQLILRTDRLLPRILGAMVSGAASVGGVVCLACDVFAHHFCRRTCSSSLFISQIAEFTVVLFFFSEARGYSYFFFVFVDWFCI